MQVLDFYFYFVIPFSIDIKICCLHFVSPLLKTLTILWQMNSILSAYCALKSHWLIYLTIKAYFPSSAAEPCWQSVHNIGIWTDCHQRCLIPWKSILDWMPLCRWWLSDLWLFYPANLKRKSIPETLSRPQEDSSFVYRQELVEDCGYISSCRSQVSQKRNVPIPDLHPNCPTSTSTHKHWYLMITSEHRPWLSSPCCAQNNGNNMSSG